MVDTFLQTWPPEFVSATVLAQIGTPVEIIEYRILVFIEQTFVSKETATRIMTIVFIGIITIIIFSTEHIGAIHDLITDCQIRL